MVLDTNNLFPKIKHLFVGYTKGKAQDDDFQHRVIGIIAFIAMIIILFFAVFNYMHGRVGFVFIDLIAVSSFAFCVFAPSSQSQLKVKRNLLLLTTAFIFLAIFIDGGVAKNGLYWSMIVPFFIFLLLGLPRAWFWTVGYALICFVIMGLHFKGYHTLPYSDAMIEYFPIMYFVSSLFAAAFEAQFERLHQRYEKTIVELEDLKKTLEQRVHTRTSDIEDANARLQHEVERHKATLKELKNSEERFFQAQKMETIGTLVGGIAHDFNNMLAGINANLFMIKRKTKENPDVQKRSTDIEQLVMRASDIIKQLLTFARKDKVELEQVDLVSFMKDAFKLAEVSISEKVHIKLENYADMLTVQANPTQLQQVLMNMLNNARDAVKKAEAPTIIVKVEHYLPSDGFKRRNPELQADSYATLTIIDNGQGIERDEIDKIFEPFYSTKEVGKGTGLGLAMCYGAIQSHGGTINVQSELGKGTAFKIFIPINHSGVKRRFDVSGTVSIGLGETILLVDDNQALRDSQKEALEALGYQVIEAKHGKEAVKLFEKHHEDIQLMVTDVTMPVMGGVKAAQKIRAIQPDILIIFVTGYDRENTMDEIPNMSECILEKPYTMDKLNKEIQQLLRTVPSK